MNQSNDSRYQSKTAIYVRIKPSEVDDILPHLKEDIRNFETFQVIEHRSIMRVVYNAKLGYLQIRELKKSVRVYEGEFVMVIRLSDQPMMSARTKRILLRGSIFFMATYLAALGGIDTFSSVEFFQSSILSVIPASVAFFTKIGDELNNS